MSCGRRCRAPRRDGTRRMTRAAESDRPIADRGSAHPTRRLRVSRRSAILFGWFGRDDDSWSGGDIAFQEFVEFRRLDGLRQIAVHAGGEAALAIAFHGVGG